jgi:phage terminase large subunit
MRRCRIFVRDTDLNAQKEFRNYKWMTDKNGKVLNQPVDAFNHIVDAVRYICLNKLMKKSGHYVYS